MEPTEETGDVKDLSLGRVISITINAGESKDSERSPKYKWVIVDSSSPEILIKSTWAIVIVPKGKESKEIYSTEDGYRQLADQVAHSRLVIVSRCEGNDDDFITIKKSLEDTLMLFTQKEVTNEIPYITEGEEKKEVEEDEIEIGKKYRWYKEGDEYNPDAPDEFENNYLIEDVLAKDQSYILRQIRFRCKTSEIQSDIKIRKKRKKGKKDWSNYAMVRSPIWPTTDREFLYIEQNLMNSEYLAAMIAGLCPYYSAFEDSEKKTDKKFNFIILGTGAGILSMFVYRTMNPMFARLNTVDIWEEFVNIGKDYFGFNPEISPKFRSEFWNAIEYLDKYPLPEKVNVLFIDIASDDPEDKTIPAKSMLTDEFANSIKKVLNPDLHVVSINTLGYSEDDKHLINKWIISHFKNVSYFTCEDSTNRVYTCSNSHAPNLTKGAENTIKYFVKTFCDPTNADSHNWIHDMDMYRILMSMKHNVENKAEVKIEEVKSALPKKLLKILSRILK